MCFFGYENFRNFIFWPILYNNLRTYGSIWMGIDVTPWNCIPYRAFVCPGFIIDFGKYINNVSGCFAIHLLSDENITPLRSFEQLSPTNRILKLFAGTLGRRPSCIFAGSKFIITKFKKLKYQKGKIVGVTKWKCLFFECCCLSLLLLKSWVCCWNVEFVVVVLSFLL